MDQLSNFNPNPYQSESREFIWYDIYNKVRIDDSITHNKDQLIHLFDLYMANIKKSQLSKWYSNFYVNLRPKSNKISPNKHPIKCTTTPKYYVT